MDIKAGYEYLLAYKISVPIYDYTIEFVKRWIDYRSRTKDQMEQAARSGMTNIPEGFKEKSLASYISLAGVAAASQEELLLDYKSYARHHGLEIWAKDKCIREIWEIGELWQVIRKTPTLPDNPKFPYLPENHIYATNMMITLCHQANYLMEQLIKSLEKKHMEEGGYREKLLKRRLEYKNNK